MAQKTTAALREELVKLRAEHSSLNAEYKPVVDAVARLLKCLEKKSSAKEIAAIGRELEKTAGWRMRTSLKLNKLKARITVIENLLKQRSETP
jgi:hypothetical protein